MHSGEKDKIISKALGKVAPGTVLREALDNILAARTGALFVIGDIQSVLPLCNGGFQVNSLFTPQRLFELSKMDGAIILDDEIKKILWANVHLVPDPSIPTDETGMRHQAAERMSKQTKALVVAISQRREVVSLYLQGVKYVLGDVRVILARANQALQTLERYKARLDEVTSSLSALEFEDLVVLQDVLNVLQRGEMTERVANEVRRYIIELGTEGRLIGMQLEELVAGVKDAVSMVIKDYAHDSQRADRVERGLVKLSSEHLLDFMILAALLGYEGDETVLDMPVHPRGYCLLSKIPRLPLLVVNKIVNKFGTLQGILKASIEDLDEVDGVGEIRAKAIQDGLKKLKSHTLAERYV